MIDFIKFIGYILSSLYNVLDVKIFPDMPITYSQLIVSLFVLVSFFRFLTFFSKCFGFTTSINDFKFNKSKESKDEGTLENDIQNIMDGPIDYSKRRSGF